jgi:phage baseplate assembly protein W
MTLYTDYTDVENIETDASAINNAIKNIIFTPKGSLPGKPTFGSDLHKVLFAPLDDVTENTMKRFIKEALTKWESRIVVYNVKVESVPEYNKLIATIDYEYRDKGLDINEQISINLIS